jgi:hypothetical protein
MPGMSPGYNEVIDGFTLIGLLSLPAYSVYWVRYHLRGEGWRRLWVGMAAFVAWCVATYFCFIRLIFWCLGGGCADRVSPFLEFAILYAFSSGVLILVMHRYRAKSG